MTRMSLRHHICCIREAVLRCDCRSHCQSQKQIRHEAGLDIRRPAISIAKYRRLPSQAGQYLDAFYTGSRSDQQSAQIFTTANICAFVRSQICSLAEVETSYQIQKPVWHHPLFSRLSIEWCCRHRQTRDRGERHCDRQ